MDVENEITAELKIPARCLGADEIARYIVDRRLVAAFLDAIGAPVVVNLDAQPDRQEIMLHSYVALSRDTSVLREQVYDDTVLLALRAEGKPLDRATLVERSVSFLGVSIARGDFIERRIDSLLNTGKLEPIDSRIGLTREQQSMIAAAERLYLAELANLADEQRAIVAKDFDIDWTPEKARTSSVLLARLFVDRQIRAAKHCSAAFNTLGFVKHIGDPRQELRDLLARSGLPVGAVESAVRALVEHARDLPLIKKLVRSAVYSAVEGSSPMTALRIFGVKSWRHVDVTVDTSVAIPYLCASLFAPTSGRFSRSATEVVRVLRKLDAHLVIPWVYLNEAASHLLRALDYGGKMAEFSDDLRHSTNGYVAQYYSLRASGQRVPDTIREFLFQFSPAINKFHRNCPEWVRDVMSDLQPALRSYGIEFESLTRVRNNLRKDLEREYTYQLDQLRRVKSGLLIEHDVHVLAHARTRTKENGEARVCLTYDGAMIAVGRLVEGCGWIVSPQDAVDLIQPSLPLDEGKLCALAHSLAVLPERPGDAAARILDRIVVFARERAQDWQFQEQIREFKQDLLARIDLSDLRYEDYIDQETDKFLKAHGIITDRSEDVELSADS